MEFEKYEAAGNDFIVVDGREADVLGVCRENAVRWCDRHFGIGADGILVVSRVPHADAYMAIVNADGSLAAMCGNGIRCVARWLYENAGVDASSILKIDTAGGLQTVKHLGHDEKTWQLDVEIARAVIGDRCEILEGERRWCGTCVDVGNPHAVFECEDPKMSMISSGHFLSNHPHFPDRCNIEFIRALGQNVIEFFVHERGVGPTLACGTGCVAAATAYAKNHGFLGETIEIHAPGGTLFVKTAKDSTQKPHLQGPAKRVFKGTI